MSEIPFVNQLGDALEAAVAAPAIRRRLRPRGRGRAWRLGLVLAVVVAGAAGAATLLSGSPVQRAAINGIGCYAGPNDGSDATFDVYGRSPIAACRRVFAAQHLALGRTGSDLVVCIGGQGPIAMVFEAQGAGQCQRMGFRPLPASYATAVVNVTAVERAMVAASRRAGCIPPRRLADRLLAVLTRFGWAGWRATIAGSGPCGTLGVDSSNRPDPAGDLDTVDHTLIVIAGAPSATAPRQR
jgi:hypothetical protein